MHVDKVVSPRDRPKSEMEKRSQDENRVLADVPNLATPTAAKGNAKNADAIDDFASRLFHVFLKADEIDEYPLPRKRLGGSARPRIGRIIGK
jgi:hypothetical protein